MFFKGLFYQVTENQLQRDNGIQDLVKEIWYHVVLWVALEGSTLHQNSIHNSGCQVLCGGRKNCPDF